MPACSFTSNSSGSVGVSPIGFDAAIIWQVPSTTVSASGVIYVFFIVVYLFKVLKVPKVLRDPKVLVFLFQNLFTVHNVDALLHLADALTSEVVDGAIDH